MHKEVKVECHKFRIIKSFEALTVFYKSSATGNHSSAVGKENVSSTRAFEDRLTISRATVGKPSRPVKLLTIGKFICVEHANFGQNSSEALAS